ncbi:hypothetical protein TNCV_4899001 [Trichonephila clavipes]|nr:hypothetical protein TNCV_4899001 [Trichonephila clavipes]
MSGAINTLAERGIYIRRWHLRGSNGIEALESKLTVVGKWLVSSDGRGRSRTVRQTYLEDVILDHADETLGTSTWATACRINLTTPTPLGKLEHLEKIRSSSYPGKVCPPLLSDFEDYGSRVDWNRNSRTARTQIRGMRSLKTHRVEGSDAC